MTVAQKVRQYREKSGMTQVQFAAHCDINLSTLISIENNRRNTSVAIISSICNALGITLAEFFDEVGAE